MVYRTLLLASTMWSNTCESRLFSHAPAHTGTKAPMRSGVLMVLLMMGMVMTLAPAWAQAEKVDNPQYQTWAQFGVGASTTHSGEAAMQGMVVTMKKVTTLTALDGDKAVLSNATTVIMGGREMPTPTQTETVAAKVESSEIDPVYQDPNSVENSQVEHGNETIKVAGRSFDCLWYSYESVDKGKPVSGKVWMCKDVPGGMVRVRGESQGSQFKMDLVELNEGN